MAAVVTPLSMWSDFWPNVLSRRGPDVTLIMVMSPVGVGSDPHYVTDFVSCT